MKQKGARIGRYEVVSVLGSEGARTYCRAVADDKRGGQGREDNGGGEQHSKSAEDSGGGEREQRQVLIELFDEEVSADEGVAAEFRELVQGVASLRHSNLARVVDWGNEGGCLFVVFELVQGVDLKQLQQCVLGRRELLSPSVVTYLGLELCHLLSFLEARRLEAEGAGGATPALGGLRPSQIRIGYDGSVCVAGIDIGAIVGDTETESQLRGARAGCLAPEASGGDQEDGRAALFSLGAILYECLTGRSPHAATTQAETVAAAAGAKREPVVNAAPNAPPSLCRAIEKLLSPDPARQFASCAELCRALEEARPPDGVQRQLGALVQLCNPPLDPLSTWSGAPHLPIAARFATVPRDGLSPGLWADKPGVGWGANAAFEQRAGGAESHNTSAIARRVLAPNRSYWAALCIATASLATVLAIGVWVGNSMSRMEGAEPRTAARPQSVQRAAPTPRQPVVAQDTRLAGGATAEPAAHGSSPPRVSPGVEAEELDRPPEQRDRHDLRDIGDRAGEQRLVGERAGPIESMQEKGSRPGIGRKLRRSPARKFGKKAVKARATRTAQKQPADATRPRPGPSKTRDAADRLALSARSDPGTVRLRTGPLSLDEF